MLTGGSGGEPPARPHRQQFQQLRMVGVSRRFGGRLALDRLDLTISGGEFVALLGHSGCGKSTALNCVAGLLPLSAGSIWIDQRRIDTLPPERRGFGMVFQNYALFPHLSVRRNVAFGLRMRGTGRDETRRRVDAALRLVQLSGYADRLPGQLSGGQQQRVAIARAVVVEPALVLMDEPLSNLDASLRLEMRTEIRRLHQELGLTTIYVTHDQEEALSLADRLVVLREGRVQQIGTPEQLYRAPENPHVAAFMGYRNLLPVRVTGGRGGALRVAGQGFELTGTDRRAPAGTATTGTATTGTATTGTATTGTATTGTATAGTGAAGESTAGADAAGGAVAAIRPEDIEVTGAGENRLDLLVEVVEYHGREQAVQGRLAGGQALRLRTTARLAPGDTVAVCVPPARVLVFATAGAEPDPAHPDPAHPDRAEPDPAAAHPARALP
jgi:putative spermidine/putrescine transport system ATP-binding protein